jgi:chorismate synthase
VVIDGCPPGIKLSLEFIQQELNRRRPGQNDLTSPRRESDRVYLRSGVLGDVTTGMPITLELFNDDVDSSAYEAIRDRWRPGHADFTYDMKYGLRDYRGSGRASGRETAARVAAGAVAKQVLSRYQIDIYAFTRAIGSISAVTLDRHQIEQNPVRSPDPIAAEQMTALIQQVKAEHDSIGGMVELRVLGLPAGLGEPVFNKFDAAMASAIMGLGAVKAVEIGDGFAVAHARGSQNNDIFIQKNGKPGTRTNHCGGVLGGITTGEEFVLRAAVKPPASIGLKQETLTQNGEATTIEMGGRHDPTIVPRIVPVVEAMAAIVILNFLLRQQSLQPYLESIRTQASISTKLP